MNGDGFRCDQVGYYIETKVGSTIDYGFDWGKWLGGRTIASSEWDVPTGATKVSSDNDDSATSVLVRADAPGTYVVTNTIHVVDGSFDLVSPRSFRLIVGA